MPVSRPPLLVVAVLLVAVAAGCRADAVSPRPLHDAALRGPDGLEIVAALDHVVGNIAVSPAGRIFITYHPEASPEVKVAEISAGNVSRPYPDAAWQQRFQSPQGIKLDTKGR